MKATLTFAIAPLIICNCPFPIWNNWLKFHGKIHVVSVTSVDCNFFVFFMVAISINSQVLVYINELCSIEIQGGLFSYECCINLVIHIHHLVLNFYFDVLAFSYIDGIEAIVVSFLSIAKEFSIRHSTLDLYL